MYVQEGKRGKGRQIDIYISYLYSEEYKSIKLTDYHKLHCHYKYFLSR